MWILTKMSSIRRVSRQAQRANTQGVEGDVLEVFDVPHFEQDSVVVLDAGVPATRVRNGQVPNVDAHALDLRHECVQVGDVCEAEHVLAVRDWQGLRRELLVDSGDGKRVHLLNSATCFQTSPADGIPRVSATITGRWSDATRHLSTTPDGSLVGCHCDRTFVDNRVAIYDSTHVGRHAEKFRQSPRCVASVERCALPTRCDAGRNKNLSSRLLTVPPNARRSDTSQQQVSSGVQKGSVLSCRRQNDTCLLSHHPYKEDVGIDVTSSKPAVRRVPQAKLEVIEAKPSGSE